LAEYESGESSSEDEDVKDIELGEQARGIAGMIALNQTYLDLIDRLVMKTENSLRTNLEEQVNFVGLSKLMWFSGKDQEDNGKQVGRQASCGSAFPCYVQASVLQGYLWNGPVDECRV
jgi:hypothetical protein